MPDELSQDDIDALLSGGSSVGTELSNDDLDALLAGAEPMAMPDFGGGGAATSGGGGGGGGEGPSKNEIEILYDVELNVRVELGRTRMTIEDILRLREGSVITFDKEAGAQVDIMVNDRLVAHGEVLVLNDLFCVRVTEILSDKDRSILPEQI